MIEAHPSAKVTVTSGHQPFLNGFPHQIWALRDLLLLESETQTFKSTLPVTSGHSPPLLTPPVALKVIRGFADDSMIYKWLYIILCEVGTWMYHGRKWSLS